MQVWQWLHFISCMLYSYGSLNVNCLPITAVIENPAQSTVQVHLCCSF